MNRMDVYEYAVIPGSIFVLAVFFSLYIWIKKYKSKRILTPLNTLAVGVFLTCIMIFVPIYKEMFSEDILITKIIKTACISIHHAIRLFVVDADFNIIHEAVLDSSGNIIPGIVTNIYVSLAAVVYVLAPVLTFGFILSFFKNISAYIRYGLCVFNNIFIFSELNEKSIELAKSISQRKERVTFVFTDVFEKNEETTYELIEKARELKAICFKKDILSIKFSFHWHRKKLSFFLIGEDESENLKQSLSLIKQYKKTENTDLFVLSTKKEGELLLSNADCGKYLKIRRINPIRSLTYNVLYNDGERIFNRVKINQQDEKEITVVIMGLGEHGLEMTKALLWFCQMSGYYLNIHVFDIEEKAKQKFLIKCPDVFNPIYRGSHREDNAKYNIEIHSGIDVGTDSFYDELNKLQYISYVYVSLGQDATNVEAAVNVRTYMCKRKLVPLIQVIVYDSEKNKALNMAKCFGESEETDTNDLDNKTCKIEYIGDLKSIYSDNVIIRSNLEKDALERHKKYSNGDEAEFWRYEYNYRSSMASAVHKELRKTVLGITEPYLEEQKNPLRIIEHNRWNAYMLTEGYSKGEKNHVAKLHNLIVPFEELPPEEKVKDDI